MIKFLLRFFTGYCRVSVPENDASAVLNLLMKYNLAYWALTRKSGCPLAFKLSLRHKRDFEALCKRASLSYEINAICGAPYFIGKYRRRAGLLVGVVLFITVVGLSTKFIWDFEVTGNETVPDSKIISTLASLGCQSGTYIKKIDFDNLHNDFLLECEDIAWIAVNMEGTVAHVEVREVKRGENAGEEYDMPCANIVAAEDGQIVLVEAVEGKATVKPFDVVKKGDILLTGVITVGEDGVRFERAKGRVLAKVYREFTVEVPYLTEQAVYTGHEKKNKSVNIFSKTINLFIKGGNSYSNYDTIERRKQITLFGSVKLPVWVDTRTFREYEITERTLTEKEAMEKASAEYRSMLDETLGGGELLWISTEENAGESSYTITCRMYCLDDIAVAVPVEIEEQGKE